MLAGCYRNSLRLVVENGVKSIAFPAISTGVYGYPIEEATRIALSETRVFLEREDLIAQVIFCCFSEADAEVYRRLFEEIFDTT